MEGHHGEAGFANLGNSLENCTRDDCLEDPARLVFSYILFSTFDVVDAIGIDTWIGVKGVLVKQNGAPSEVGDVEMVRNALVVLVFDRCLLRNHVSFPCNMLFNGSWRSSSRSLVPTVVLICVCSSGRFLSDAVRTTVTWAFLPVKCLSRVVFGSSSIHAEHPSRMGDVEKVFEVLDQLELDGQCQVRSMDQWAPAHGGRRPMLPAQVSN